MGGVFLAGVVEAVFAEFAGVDVAGDKDTSGSAVVDYGAFSACAYFGEEHFNAAFSVDQGGAYGIDAGRIELSHLLTLYDKLFQKISTG